MNKDEYANYKLVFKMRDEDTLEQMRHMIEKIYGINHSGFLISIVSDMLISKLFNTQAKVKDLVNQ